MKNYYRLVVLIVFVTFFAACSSDDNATPDVNVIAYKNYTKDMFMGTWEHYAVKKIEVNLFGNINTIEEINYDDLNDPCYYDSTTYKNVDIIHKENDYDAETSTYSCNSNSEFINKWMYEDGEPFYNEIVTINGQIYEDTWYIHFDKDGSLIVWEGDISGEQIAWYYRKVN